MPVRAITICRDLGLIPNEAGDEIPLPSTDETYSGKLLLRMPKSLHRRLTEGAIGEGVSLNQYIVYLLSATGK